MKRIIIGLLIVTGVVLLLFNCDNEIKRVEGCTDYTALNYDPDAEKDDNSCISIGSEYLGGYLAYVLQQGDPGYDPDVPHGLIAAPYDQGVSAWGCPGFLITGTSPLVGTGQANTTQILDSCSDANCAANVCNVLVLGEYDDWYLPSKDELNKLYLNKYAIGGFSNSNYWTSTEEGIHVAWYQDFNTGSQSYDYWYFGQKSVSNYVRAIRSF
jgi:hypothetical protein